MIRELKRTSVLLSISLVIFLYLSCSKSEFLLVKYLELEKVGEITEIHSDEKLSGFINISSMCCDDENNLYVADSSWNKIFKFNPQGEHINSYGRAGQGPGEFMASTKSISFLISFGNDGNFYVQNSDNRRISIFNREFQFIKAFSIPQNLHDTPRVNSNGDIYLIAPFGDYVINCYDRKFNVKDHLLESKLHFIYPISKPPEGPMKNFVTFINLRKVITKNDHLFALSNNALEIFHFDNKNKLIHRFKIKNKIFLNDFKKDLKTTIKTGGFSAPFIMHLDENENLCLFYWNNSIKTWEIYRYHQDGTFLDILKFQENTKINPPFCIDRQGNFFGIGEGQTKIEKYKLKNSF